MTQRMAGLARTAAGAMAAILLLGAFQVAFAQDGDRGRGRSRGRSDGERRAQEFLQQHPDADKNGDGRISREEFGEYLQAHPELRRDRGPGGRGGPGDPGGRGRPDFAQRGQELLKDHPEADKNGDGRLSRDEFGEFFRANPEIMRDRMRSRMLQDHPELDADKDGKISDEEMQAARSRFEGRRRDDLLRRHPELDTDKDGKLSEEEMQAARAGFEERHRQDTLRRHPEADKAGDGKLSDEEMRASHEERMRRWNQGQRGPNNTEAQSASPAAQQPQSGETRSRRSDGRDRGASDLGRGSRDPWAQYVERFCEQYKLDASQRATTQSILREFTERRAKLTGQSEAGKDKDSAKAVDSLFKELKERLDQVPRSSQRTSATTKPAS